MSLFLSSSIVLGVVFVLISLVLSLNKKNPTPSGLILPAGKLGWPIIGETLQFILSGQRDYFKRFFGDRMNKYSSDVFRTSLFGNHMAVVCGRSGNKLVFSNEDKLFLEWHPHTIKKIFLSANLSASELLSFRRTVAEILKREALHKYVPLVEGVIEQHFEREWIPNSKVTVYPLVKKLAFSLACRLFIGIEDPECEAKLARNFSQVIRGMFSLPIDFPGTTFNRGIKAANVIRNDLLPIIRQRRSDTLEGNHHIDKRDLLSQLLLKTNEDGKFLGELEIADKILGILVASHDSTSSVITSAIYYLTDNPHIYQRVLDEQVDILKSKGPKKLLEWEDILKMKYSRNFLNEVLRMAPPALGTFRETITDVTYADCTIPKGWKVFWSVHTTHRNPEYFPNPEKFDPSRFEAKVPTPFTYVPFGGGPRMCPGAEFGRLVVLIAIHSFVTKFRWEKLIPNEKIVGMPFTHPSHGFPIQLFPRENYS